MPVTHSFYKKISFGSLKQYCQDKKKPLLLNKDIFLFKRRKYPMLTKLLKNCSLFLPYFGLISQHVTREDGW